MTDVSRGAFVGSSVRPDNAEESRMAKPMPSLGLPFAR